MPVPLILKNIQAMICRQPLEGRRSEGFLLPYGDSPGSCGSEEGLIGHLTQLRNMSLNESILDPG